MTEQEAIEYYRERGATIGPSAAETSCLITVNESQVKAKEGSKVKKGTIDKESAKARQKAFQALCQAHGLGKPEPEYIFHETRKWRFDWAWPLLNIYTGESVGGGIALEIDGGAWSQGRHTRGKGFIADQEKRNEAVISGWKVIHCVPEDIETGKVFDWLKRILK